MFQVFHFFMHISDNLSRDGGGGGGVYVTSTYGRGGGTHTGIGWGVMFVIFKKAP